MQPFLWNTFLSCDCRTIQIQIGVLAAMDQLFVSAPPGVSLNGNVRPKRDAGCLFTLGADRFVCQQVASVYFSHRWLQMSTPPTPTGVSANMARLPTLLSAIVQSLSVQPHCVCVCVHRTHKEKACFDFMQMLHHKNLYPPPSSLCVLTLDQQPMFEAL